jgi:hypothetical protein
VTVERGFPFEPPARLHAVEIAVEINLQQRRWMVRWAPSGLGDDTLEAQCCQIQFVDERFNNPDWVVLRHVVIQAVREQHSLPPVLAFHETFHPAIPQ